MHSIWLCNSVCLWLVHKVQKKIVLHLVQIIVHIELNFFKKNIFLEHAGELCLIILRGKKCLKWTKK
jgi:hypothetical protein